MKHYQDVIGIEAFRSRLEARITTTAKGLWQPGDLNAGVAFSDCERKNIATACEADGYVFFRIVVEEHVEGARAC